MVVYLPSIILIILIFPLTQQMLLMGYDLKSFLPVDPKYQFYHLLTLKKQDIIFALEQGALSC